jgi:phosphoglucomutase
MPWPPVLCPSQITRATRGEDTSGTEDVHKIYAESFRSKDHLQQIQREAQMIVDRVLRETIA